MKDPIAGLNEVDFFEANPRPEQALGLARESVSRLIEETTKLEAELEALKADQAAGINNTAEFLRKIDELSERYRQQNEKLQIFELRARELGHRAAE